MKVSEPTKEHAENVASFFRDVFTASENAEEGALIGQLAFDLLQKTPTEDLYAFLSSDEKGPTGCIFFTRLSFADDPRTVFLMAPVAVRTDRQKQGVGQQLIRHGLEALRLRGVDVVLTYGDPAYYGKTGFNAIDESIVRPPLPLTFPHGWLGQSLTENTLEALRGASRCVPAFDKPELW